MIELLNREIVKTDKQVNRLQGGGVRQGRARDREGTQKRLQKPELRETSTDRVVDCGPYGPET